jgi:hypothetical protein
MSSSKHASLVFLYCLPYSTAASITSSCLAPPLAAAAYASSAFRPNSLCSYMSLHLSEQEQVQDQEGASAAHRVPAAEPSNRHRHALSYYVLGEARTILLRHIINASPSKQASYGTYLPQGIYGARLLFVSVRTNQRHHHHRGDPKIAHSLAQRNSARRARTHMHHAPWHGLIGATGHESCAAPATATAARLPSPSRPSRLPPAHSTGTIYVTYILFF